MAGWSAIYAIAACPEPGCGGWAAWHFHEGVGGMWHNHDGRRVDFKQVLLVSHDEANAEVDGARAQVSALEEEVEHWRDAALQHG